MSQVVVITGASAGVGRATARRFARDGARLGLLARGEVGLEATRREVEELGGQALAIPTDVADYAQVKQAAEQIEERFGPIDVWINNAMVTVFSPVKKMQADEFRRVTEVTYLGTVHGTMVALEHMQERDQGVILQVGSVLAYRAIPLQSAYCGAKHAIQGFSESLRSELMHDDSGISLSMVQLPALNTPQFEWSRNKMGQKAQPVPPIYEPEVAAEAIHWAVSETPREMSVGMRSSLILNLNKFFPGVGDKYLAENGYSSQMLEEPSDPERGDNLFAPVERDAGARGPFSDRARASSRQLWVSSHKGLLMAAAGALAAGTLLAIKGKNGKGEELPDTRSPEAHRIP